MKSYSFSTVITIKNFRETAWGKGVVFFAAAMIMWNAAFSGPLLTPEKQEMLQKIVAAQSTLFQFFSFSSLPIMIVDNLLKRTGLGTAAPERTADESQSSNAQCDRCIVRPAVENNRHYLKILFHFVAPLAVYAVIGRLLLSIFRERWENLRQSMTGIRPRFFLLPRSSISEEAIVVYYRNTSARPDSVSPGIFMSYKSSGSRGLL